MIRKLNKKCPFCEALLVLEEDWPTGRISRCESCSYRKVERFDQLQSSELLDKQEKGEENDAA